jgi:hypothetical protein
LCAGDQKFSIINLMTRACLFCGANGSAILSDEHIVPQWLLRHFNLPEDDQMFQGVANSDTGEFAAAPRVHSSFRFVEGRVCAACNSGWMSRLEDAARPVLTALIDRGREISSLSSSESAVISKWAVKTAYLVTYAGPMRSPVQLDHVRLLCGDSSVPHSGVGVFAMQADYTQPSGYIQTGQWPQLAPPDVAIDRETPRDAYKIGLQFRHLYLLVAFWPNPSALLYPKKDLHIPLLPGPSRPDVNHTLDLIMGSGPIDRLAAFTNSLGVVRLDTAV